MGECGCTMNDRKYWFPGPGRFLYLLTLSAGCIDCDAPSGVTIELLKPGDFMAERKHLDEFTEGPLPFEKWSDSMGVAVVAGLRRHEFVAKLRSHLVGVDSNELGTDGVLDEDGADVILEEAYEDSVVMPHFPAAPKNHKG